MSNYTVAIIGTGRVGAQFDFVPEHPDNHADAIAVNDSFTLVAGVNRGREKLDLFGERYGIDALYHDYLRMLAEVGPDVCIIATPPSCTRRWSRDAPPRPRRRRSSARSPWPSRCRSATP